MQWIKQRYASWKGNQAEQLACDYLKNRGLILVTRNYRCKRGEIDLIMQDAGVLVFVEVKFRQDQDHGRAEEFFHPHKRAKFALAMQQYLHQHKLNPAHTDHRIDVVAINGDEVNWIKQV